MKSQHEHAEVRLATPVMRKKRLAFAKPGGEQPAQHRLDSCSDEGVTF
jgi:hypothetical protein